jgi:putative membrane protein
MIDFIIISSHNIIRVCRQSLNSQGRINLKGFAVNKETKMSKGTRTALIVVGTVLGVLIVLAFILGAYWGWGMMGPRMMYGYGGGWYMGIIMLVIWGLIIWGIIALIRHFSGTLHNDSHNDSTLEILKKSYAKGEINKEEFEEKKKALL